jgi:hypothetical protein
VTLFRRVYLLLLFLGICPLWSKAAQDQGARSHSDKSRNQDLELTTTGQVRLSAGRRGMLRIYTASDGAQGSVIFGRFTSPDDADQQIKEWLKLADRVTSTESKKDSQGRLIGQRNVAAVRDEKSGKDSFLIITRNNLECYLIRSLSMHVALQVEDMLREK